MSYTYTGYFGAAGGGKSGATVDAWLVSRFSSAPQEGTNPPSGTPNAGPVTTAITYGGPGAYTLTLPSVSDYYVRVQYGGVQYWTSLAAGKIVGGGTGGSAQLTIPGIVPNSASFDNAPVINAYLTALGAYCGDTPQVLPAGLIYVQSEIIPLAGQILRGSGWGQDGASNYQGTTIVPGVAGMTRVASCTNNDSGFKNLNVSGLPHNNGNVATYAFGVYAQKGILENFGAYGGSTCTFDSNTSSGADALNMHNFEINTEAGGPGPATSQTACINAQGADWVVTLGRMVNGTKVLSGDQCMWSDIHFTSASGGGTVIGGYTANVVDQGGQYFSSCEFDSLPSTACSAKRRPCRCCRRSRASRS